MLAMAALYIVCTLFVFFWPVLAVKLLGAAMHMVNVEKFAGDVQLTWGNFFLGFVPLLFYTYIGAWIFSWLHNRAMKH